MKIRFSDNINNNNTIHILNSLVADYNTLNGFHSNGLLKTKHCREIMEYQLYSVPIEHDVNVD